MRLIDADELFRTPMPCSRHNGKPLSSLWAYVVDQINHAPTIEAEPVRHGRWIDRYGGKYANHLYECSECKGTALYKYEVDVLDNGHFVQALSAACPHCRAKMDVTDINVGNKGGEQE